MLFPFTGLTRFAELLKLIVFPLPIEWLRRLPCALEDLDILFQTCVALIFRKEVAFFGLLSVAATSNEMHNCTASRQLVQSCKGFGSYGGVDCVGAEGDDDLEILCMRGNCCARCEGVK